MADPEAPVVVVSGASRGIGRGVALAFGAVGATVYVVGRSERDGVGRDGEMALPGTIGATVAAVNDAGGRGVAALCDLAVDTQIAALFDRVRAESGRLDVLVNNAAFLLDDGAAGSPFWERSPRLADILGVGLRCHYLASRAAVPLMLGRAGLIVNMSFYGGARMHDPAYCAAKAGLDAMADAMARDLDAMGIAAVSLWPGVVATERLELLAEQMPDLAAQLSGFETPDFVGRVIAALHADPRLMDLSGKTLIAAELAQRYGVTEADGRRPVSYRGVYGAPRPDLDAAGLLGTEKA